MQTVDISGHQTALSKLAHRHQVPVAEVIDRILRHGIEREDHLFDWSPAPRCGVAPVPVEAFLPDPFRQRQTA